MTTDLSTDSRRAGEGFSSSDLSTASHASGSPTRELPVLFQLADVSRPKGSRPRPPAPSAAASATAATAELQLAPLAEAPASSEPADDPNLLTLSELAKPYTPAALQPSTLWTPSVASLLEDPTTPSAAPVASAPPTTAQPPSQPAAAQATETPPEPKAKDSSATAARRREQREAAAKPSPAKKHDWFSSHGKLISIGFVLALAATVYIARNHKQAATPVNNDSWSLKHPGDAADQLAAGPVIEMPTAASSEPPREAVASDTKGETSPADKLVESEQPQDNPSGAAQVDLLPPTLPLQTLPEQNVATAPATGSTPAAPAERTPVENAVAKTPATEAASAPSDDPLFRWPQPTAQPETRVATRPELPALPPGSTAPAVRQSMNPGEVLNPYTSATATAAAPPPSDAPAATVARRSPYALPSPQETASAPAAPSVYAPANPPGSVYSSQSVYAPAPQTGYAAAPPTAGYAPAPPTTPSPYMPAESGATPPAAGQPASSYGAPPTAAPNTQPPASGYRYERTGSGLY